MLAMVLAIGLLVDDAIVVVENVERIMADEGLSPKEATRKSMGQITSALIGIGLVLSAVFGPMAFFGGSTGVIYRQFSVTMITSMLLSVLVALILTPVLCASLLRPEDAGHKLSGPFSFLHRFFAHFDRGVFRLRDVYVRIVGHSFSKKTRYVVIYLVIVIAVGILFMRLPTAYLPDEDQGALMGQVTLPAGATMEQMMEALKQAEDYFKTNENEAVASCMTTAGAGFSGTAQSNGMIFIRLKDWEERDTPDLRAKAVAGRAMMAL
jgi:HAE1 family hydrophobic/amphiphilic exporter-1